MHADAVVTLNAYLVVVFILFGMFFAWACHATEPDLDSPACPLFAFLFFLCVVCAAVCGGYLIVAATHPEVFNNAQQAPNVSTSADTPPDR